jgi:hypothetical protein
LGKQAASAGLNIAAPGDGRSPRFGQYALYRWAILSHPRGVGAIPDHGFRRTSQWQIAGSFIFVKRLLQGFLHSGRQFIGIGQKKADLPHLVAAHRAAEPRHAGQPYAICDFPVSDSRRIVRNALALEKLRRLRKLSLCNRRLIPSWQAVTNRAVVPVDDRSRRINVVRCQNRR